MKEYKENVPSKEAKVEFEIDEYLAAQTMLQNTYRTLESRIKTKYLVDGVSFSEDKDTDQIGASMDLVVAEDKELNTFEKFLKSIKYLKEDKNYSNIGDLEAYFSNKKIFASSHNSSEKVLDELLEPEGEWTIHVNGRQNINQLKEFATYLKQNYDVSVKVVLKDLNYEKNDYNYDKEQELDFDIFGESEETDEEEIESDDENDDEEDDEDEDEEDDDDEDEDDNYKRKTKLKTNLWEGVVVDDNVVYPKRFL